MASYPKHPVVDSHNPFYCPAIPARAYIHSLHQGLTRHPHTTSRTTARRILGPFTRVLARALDTPGNDPSDKGIQDSDLDTSGSLSASSTSTTASDTSASGETTSRNEQTDLTSNRHRYFVTSARGTGAGTRTVITGAATADGLSHNSISSNAALPPSRFNRLRDSHILARPPKKRKERHHDPHDTESRDSDLNGPPKHARSFLGKAERSFEVRLKREALNFDLASSGDSNSSTNPPSFASDSSIQPMQSSESSSSQEQGGLEMVLTAIQAAAPGIKIPFYKSGHPNLITGYLAENGLLTAPLMRIIGRCSGVSELSLSSSVHEHNGLNLGRVTELLPELHSPGLFNELTHLTCSGVLLTDDAVLHFHCLPLRILNLCKTGIGNAAVFMLVSHKSTLNQLFISNNRGVDDDAIPALMMLKRLSDLSITGTRVTMRGLRRYAKAINREKRAIRIEMPGRCKKYVDEEMQREYLIVIDPPLFSKPEQCFGQRSVDLRKNLIAHSVVNRRITTSGNRAELAERLAGILEQREGDLLVKKVLENARARGGLEETSEYDDDGRWGSD